MLDKLRSVLWLAATALAAPAQMGMLDTVTTAGWVVVPDAPDLEPVSTVTVEAWFYFDSALPGSGPHPTIVRKNPAVTNHPYLLRVETTPLRVQWGVWTTNNGYSQVDSPGNLTPNVWHHAAGVYDGTALSLHLDGQLVASAPKSGALFQTTSNLMLGTGNAPAETWRGKLDEIRIWSVARTPAQIQSTRFHRIDAGTGLLGAWHFDAGSFADAVGGHGGSPVGGATIVPSTAPLVSAHLAAPNSVGEGAVVAYALLGTANAAYYMDVTFAGAQPGTPLPAPAAGVLPLNPPYLFTQFGAFLPGVFTGFFGVFGADGTAVASMDLPDVPGYVGVVFTAAFFTIDATAPAGIGPISNPATTAVVAPPPVVASVSPATGPSSGGTTVVVTGADFLPGATVKFDAQTATNVVVVSPTTISCTTPLNAAGPADVQVTNPDGGVGTATAAYSYFQALALTAATPNNAAPGIVVTLSGVGFVPGATVAVDGVPAVVVSNASSTFLTFVQPAGFSCDAAVVVALPNGQVGQIVTNPSSTIGTLIGRSGPAAGGGALTLVGTNFSASTAVTIGGVPATISGFTATTLSVVAPPGAPGPAVIAATTWNCSAYAAYLYY